MTTLLDVRVSSGCSQPPCRLFTWSESDRLMIGHGPMTTRTRYILSFNASEFPALSESEQVEIIMRWVEALHKL